QFEPKLNLACLPRGVHDPEAGAFEHPGRRKEIGVIRRIERVGPKLELCLFRKSEAAEDRGVERHNSVSADMSDPLIAERIWSRLAESARVEPAQQRAFGGREIRVSQDVGPELRAEGHGRIGRGGYRYRTTGLQGHHCAERPSSENHAA